MSSPKIQTMLGRGSAAAAARLVNEAHSNVKAFFMCGIERCIQKQLCESASALHLFSTAVLKVLEPWPAAWQNEFMEIGQLIVKTPGTCGGRARLAGKRIPVS